MPRNDHFQDITVSGNISPGDLSRVDNSLIPANDNTEDLGTAALRWRTAYVGTISGDVDTETSIQHVDASGADANTGLSWTTAKATASSAHTALPSTGGVIYIAPGSTGITLSADPFTGMTKNTHVIILPGTLTAAVSLTFPINVTVEILQGARIQANTGVTVTFQGSFKAPNTTVFTWSGTGAFRFGGQIGTGFDAFTPRINVMWWGATNDGATDSSSAITAAFAANCTGGGTIEMHGRFLSVTAPTFCSSVSNGTVTVEGSGQWIVRSQLVPRRRYTLLGRGSGFSGTIGPVQPQWTIQANSFASDVALVSMTDSGGALNFINVHLSHNKNAPVFSGSATSALYFENVRFENSSTGTSADGVQLDGTFEAYFINCDSSTNGGGSTGPFAYDLQDTTATVPDTGIVHIIGGMIHNSCVRIGGDRAPTGVAGNLIMERVTLEGNNCSATVLLDRSNNIYPQFVTLDGVTDADGAGTSNFDCIGTPTVGGVIRGLTIRHNEFATPIGSGCSGQQVEYTVDTGHAFTGNMNPGTGQKIWKFTNYGPLDAQWLYAGGMAEPSWTPFAAASAIPNQASTSWSAYTEVSGNATTVTTGILDPFGGTAAGRMTCASGTCGKYVDENLTLAVGDWIAFGGWARSNDSAQALSAAAYGIEAVGGCATFDVGKGVNATQVDMSVEAHQHKRIGTSIDWFPLSRIVKVATSVSNPCTIRFTMTQESTRPTERYKPFKLVIPASASVSDGAIIRAWRAGAFNNIYSGAPANAVVGNAEAEHLISKLNRTKYIDGVKYPRTAAGINAAITDASAGQTIELTEGTYTWNATVTVSKALRIKMPGGTFTATVADPGQTTGALFNITANDVTIEGSGWNTILKKTGATNQQALISSGALDRITIRNLKMDGDEANHTTVTSKYYTCWVSSQNSQDLTLDNVEVTGCGNRAIDWRSTVRGKILNSYFHQTGIATVDGTPLAGNATSLESETITPQCADAWFVNNLFEEWGDSAIGGGTCIGVHVIGNTLKGRAYFGNTALTEESGIDLLGARDVEVVGNHVFEIRGSALAATCYQPAATMFVPVNIRIAENLFYNVASLAAGDPRVVFGQGGGSCQPVNFTYTGNTHIGTRLSAAGISGFIATGNTFQNIRSNLGGTAVDMGQGAGGVFENFIFNGNTFDTDNATLTLAFNVAAAITAPENSAFIGNVVGTGVTTKITYQAGAQVVPELWPDTASDSFLVRRIRASQGTALVAGDFALDANWGAGAAVSAVTGTDQAWQMTVTAAGIPALNAGVTLTFKDGTWTNAPICQAQVIGGTGAVADMTGLPTATTWPLVYAAVPVAASTYIITGVCFGR